MDSNCLNVFPEVLYEHIGTKSINGYGTKESPKFMALDVGYWTEISSQTIAVYVSRISDKASGIANCFHGDREDWLLSENAIIELLTMLQIIKPEISAFKAAFIVMMNEWKMKNCLTEIKSEYDNGMQIFQNEQFGKIRTIDRNGEPWFLAADICKALDISNPTDALGRLDKDERTLVSIEGSRNGLPINFVNEAGLYTLILGSRKKEARDFKRWVTHDVIPTIRKTGGYIANDDAFIDHYLPNADSATKEFVKMSLVTVKKQDKLICDQRMEIQAKSEIIEVLKPKAEVYDALASTDNLMTITDAAKNIGVRVSDFVDYCIEHKYLFREKMRNGKPKGDLRPFSAALSKGLFAYRERYCESADKSYGQTLVTFAGREFFSKKINGKKNA